MALLVIPFYCMYVSRPPAFGTGWNFLLFSSLLFSSLLYFTSALLWLAMYTLSPSRYFSSSRLIIITGHFSHIYPISHKKYTNHPPVEKTYIPMSHNDLRKHTSMSIRYELLPHTPHVPPLRAIDPLRCAACTFLLLCSPPWLRCTHIYWPDRYASGYTQATHSHFAAGEYHAMRYRFVVPPTAGLDGCNIHNGCCSLARKCLCLLRARALSSGPGNPSPRLVHVDSGYVGTSSLRRQRHVRCELGGEKLRRPVPDDASAKNLPREASILRLCRSSIYRPYPSNYT
jgi:hypothetical protein